MTLEKSPKDTPKPTEHPDGQKRQPRNGPTASFTRLLQTPRNLNAPGASMRRPHDTLLL